MPYTLAQVREDAIDDVRRNRTNIFLRFMDEPHKTVYLETRAEMMREKAIQSARDHIAYGWASCPPYGLDKDFHPIYFAEFERLKLTSH